MHIRLDRNLAHLQIRLRLLEHHRSEDVGLGLRLPAVVVDDLLEADLFELRHLADAVYG